MSTPTRPMVSTSNGAFTAAPHRSPPGASVAIPPMTPSRRRRRAASSVSSSQPRLGRPRERDRRRCSGPRASPPILIGEISTSRSALPRGPRSRSLVPELLHQLTLEHLARRAERERVHELDPARVLVLREVLLGVPRDLGPQFGVRDAGRRWVLHDHRTDLLAVLRVRDPDDGHLVHPRVMGEDLLDFTRVDVEPAPQNHVLLPVDDGDEPLLVPDGQVTGSEPFVDDRGLGRLGAVPVALHHVVAADHYLADLARREQLDAVLELGVRDLDLDPPNRVADGAGLAPEHLL